MRTHTRLILGALTAALVLAAAVGTASANRLSISNRNFTARWNPLTFSTGPEAEGITVSCNVTIEGSYHYNTIIKVRRSLVGYLTKAVVGHPCTGGEAWAHNGIERNELGIFGNNLPWHITYEGFEGTLPAIAGIRQLLFTLFTIRAIGILCEYTGNAQGVVKLGRGGVATNIQPDENLAIPKSGGSIFCPTRGFFRARTESSRVTLLGNTTPITVTLI